MSTLAPMPNTHDFHDMSTTYVPWTRMPYIPPAPPPNHIIRVPTGTDTSNEDLLGFKRAKRLEELLEMVHDELLASDDPDHLALAELIEEALEV